MTALKIALVDDEPLARERLSRLLRGLDCEVVAELEDGPALLEWMRGSPTVDGLFLDIQMPGATGLEVLAELEAPPPVVFVTAHAEHAVRAFEADETIDYVLKPVFADRLERSVARLRNRQVPQRSGPELRALVSGPTPRFQVKAGQGNVFLDLRKVSHFEVVDEIVWAWAGGARFRTLWTAISDVEGAFPGRRLLRIQRHVLLRLDAVVGYRSLPGGRWKVRVSEGAELEVSRTATPKLREQLGLG